MDFSQVDLKKFLKAAIKVRFQGISPYDFEDFIGKLFLDNGYKVENTNYSGDFGADLILDKDGVKTVVQIKRYHEDHKVGVQDINQVLGAAKYYGGHQIMIVTTSSFTQPAIELCKKTQVFYWDWQVLKDAVYNTYQIDDEWLYDIDGSTENKNDDVFRLSVIEVEVDEHIESIAEPLTKVVLELENISGKNAHVFIDLPILLTQNNKQYNAVQWVKNYFSSGVIFNGASVEIACYFLEDHLSQVHKEDKILLPTSVPSLSFMNTLSAPLSPDDQRCFVVSFAFNRFSSEYYTAIRFRDQQLLTYFWGRQLVSLYYILSPIMVEIIRPFPFLQKMFRRIIYRLLKSMTGGE
ncbi:restriction endonuclease [Membranihabitans marinus]|uniref:restriction endonuclease n=1 Tax=Membranihabitans marinus TaxID=1227546 RepID=UPI001F1FB19B|nr:restriction endonuclease [Membranihabitans marinus]